MGFLKKLVPPDPKYMENLRNVLKKGTHEELLKIYDKSYLDHYYWQRDDSMLAIALNGNRSSADKVKNANLMLDDGAKTSAGSLLHRLFGSYVEDRDFKLEAELAKRLLDAGVDVNEVYGKFGTPLECAAQHFKFSEKELQPIYDAILARPDVDFLAPRLKGQTTTYGLIVKMGKLRPKLLTQVEAYMQQHNQPIPGKA